MRDAVDPEEARWAAFDASLRSVPRPEAEPSLAAACMPGAARVPEPCRVLVVDDEPNIRRLIVHHLTQAGYAVRTASDGAEALAEIDEHRPDLLILDVMMPRVSGLTVLDQIKGDPRTAEIPVVLLTARDADDQIRHGWQQGTDFFMPKPFDPRELCVVVDRMTAVLGTPENPPPLRRWPK